MAHYRVRVGKQLPHHGRLVASGDLVSLPKAVAEDTAVSHYLDWVDDIDDLPKPVIVPGKPQAYDVSALPIVLTLPHLEPAPIPQHDEVVAVRLVKEDPGPSLDASESKTKKTSKGVSES